MIQVHALALLFCCLACWLLGAFMGAAWSATRGLTKIYKEGLERELGKDHSAALRYRGIARASLSLLQLVLERYDKAGKTVVDDAQAMQSIVLLNVAIDDARRNVPKLEALLK